MYNNSILQKYIDKLYIFVFVLYFIYQYKLILKKSKKEKLYYNSLRKI